MSSTKVVFACVILYHTILGNKDLFQNGRLLLTCIVFPLSYTSKILTPHPPLHPSPPRTKGRTHSPGGGASPPSLEDERHRIDQLQYNLSTSSSVGDPYLSLMDPDPTPFFSDFKDVKNINLFHIFLL
jgi:hypothetical protein